MTSFLVAPPHPRKTARFPRLRLRKRCLPPDSGCSFPVLEEPGGNASPAHLLLQWLCQVPSIPCPTAILLQCTSAYRACRHAMIRIRDAVGALQTHREAICRRACLTALPSPPRFAAHPGQICRYVGTRNLRRSPCPKCRKSETRSCGGAACSARSSRYDLPHYAAHRA